MVVPGKRSASGAKLLARRSQLQAGGIIGAGPRHHPEQATSRYLLAVAKALAAKAADDPGLLTLHHAPVQRDRVLRKLGERRGQASRSGWMR